MPLFEEINCKTIFEQLPIASWIVDAETLKIVRINNTAVELYGYSKDEFKKFHVWDINVSEDKKETLNLAKKIKKLKYFSLKTKHITKDRQILDVTVAMNLIKIHDNHYFNVTCQNNTHEQKVVNKLDYVEKKFELFFNQLPDTIFIIDQNLEKIVNANKAATELLGYSEEELKKINFSSLVQFNQSSKSCKEVIQNHLECGVNSFEQKFLKKDGKSIDTSVSLKKLNSPYGINVIVTCRDITIQKLEEYELKELNKSLTKIIDVKVGELYENERLLLEQSKLAQMGEMLNMIAHQWRQPLNAISTAALNVSFQNELGTLESDNLEEISKFIQDETQRMSQIINDFMEFNKSEPNCDFLIYKAVSEVEKLIAPQLKNRSITLEIDIDKELQVFHNAKSIEHVLLNLITNAKDAFENQHANRDKTVKIYASSDKDFTIINVEDNAGGIGKEIINKVFNPYFTTKGQGKGTGIGLYMSKRLVEGVDGSLLSIKNSEEGAVFSIAFKK